MDILTAPLIWALLCLNVSHAQIFLKNFSEKENKLCVPQQITPLQI